MGRMICRDPQSAARLQYDIIVVGGGIYGSCLVLEAARRGLSCLLIEKDDFGQATSWNCLRIIHGGLRYLQQLDIHRFRESVAERRWFLQHFPDLVEPISCLMPLYGRGLRRPIVLSAALSVNDFLTRRRNQGVRADRRIDQGCVLSESETLSLFPKVERKDLKGAALWHDAIMRSPQRLLMEILRWACNCGATVLNYVEALELVTHGGDTHGVIGIDREADARITFHAPVVVNCAGPWCRDVVRRFDQDIENLFFPSLAFNVLLDTKPLSEKALAVSANRPNAQTLFLVPWKEKILVGTFHASWHGSVDNPKVSPTQLSGFLEELNSAIPGLNVTLPDVLRVYAGLLPAAATHSNVLAVKETVVDHSRRGGPRGLYSVSGVKYTTARCVAEKILQHIFGGQKNGLDVRCQTDRPALADWFEFESMPDFLRCEPNEAASKLRSLMDEEAVLHLDDLLLRRTDWTQSPSDVRIAADVVCDLLGWDESRRKQELARIGTISASAHVQLQSTNPNQPEAHSS